MNLFRTAIAVTMLLAASQVLAQDPPLFSQDIDGDFAGIGGVVEIEFVIDNTAGASEVTGLAFSNTLPAGLVLATPSNASTFCDGATLVAADGTKLIDFSGGTVFDFSLCTVRVNVEAVALGVQANLTGDLTSSAGNSGTSSDSITIVAAGSAEWTAPGQASWFDGSSWQGGVTPSTGLDANINNGGTAVVPIDLGPAGAQTLNIGVDGGAGQLVFDSDFGAELNVSNDLNIGYTATGTDASTGSVEFGEFAGGLFAFREQPMGMIRIGVTEADGDADGTLIYPDSFISQVPTLGYQVGVSTGAGNATAQITMEDANTSGLPAEEQAVEIGVAHADGHATAIFNGGEIDGESSADIGVSNGAGDAFADVAVGFRFEGANNAGLRGPANIGVSNSTGSATGIVAQQLNVFGSVTNEFWTELNIGIANGTGAADGTLLNSNGINVPIMNVGLNPGGGSALGHVFVDHGLLRADVLTLGAGSTLEFTANAPNRATGGGSGTVYSAVNSDAATLAGELRINLTFVPMGPLTFEMVNTTSPTGITGTFDNVVVSNVPNGLTVVPGVQLDGMGNEQFVVELQGAPILPFWDNPATGASAGDWFTASNWDSGVVPTAAEPATINNGGEAVANSGTAPGAIAPRDVIIGIDGGTGLMTSNGVDVTPGFSFLMAQVSPLNPAEQTATGTMVLNDATIEVTRESSPSQSAFDPGAIIGIGFAQGSGTAVASMEVNNGSLIAGEDVHVGAALPIAVDATPTANGQLIFNGAGIGVSRIVLGEFDGLHIAYARDANTGPGAQPTASATATVQHATVEGDINVAFADAFTEDAISMATADSVLLSNLEVTGGLDVAIADAFDPNNRATVSANVMASDIVFLPSGEFFDLGEADAGDPGAVAVSTATIDLTRITITTTGDFEVGFADTFDPDTQATNTTHLTLSQSVLTVDELQVAEVDGSDNGVSSTTVDVALSETTVTGENFELGETDVGATSQALVDAKMTVTGSAFSLTESVLIGELAGDSTNASTSVDVELNLIDTSVLAPEVRIGEREPGVAGTLAVDVTLNPSFMDTDLLSLFADGTMTFGIDGPIRVTADTVGMSGTYAAIDAADALIEGTLIADLQNATPDGLQQFDLVVTAAPGALDDFAGTLETINVPPEFTVLSFGVVEEGGVDRLRLLVETPAVTFSIGGTVSGLAAGQALVLQNNGGDDLAIAIDGPFTFATPLDDGSDYAVTILSEPNRQSCAVTNGSGTLEGADVTNVQVACTDIMLGLSETDLDLGQVLVDETGSGTITVSNPGDGNLTLSDVSMPSAPFALDGGSCLDVPVTLASSESCMIGVSFSPTEPGDFDEELVITSNAASSPDTVRLSGSASKPLVPVPTLSAWGLILMMLLMTAATRRSIRSTQRPQARRWY